ncbi:MAG: hypothetical protein ILO36_04470 [Abditibacteriota bacterium]|nr:hypothetical protein [Abditibacteriota bacterium]
MYLTLKDGTAFEGKCLSKTKETAGFLSIYTGAFGYEEVITNPANTGKIILFTFPEIGATGVNHEDNQSDTVCVAGFICKEYSRYMSNFRAKESLLHYMDSADRAVGEGFDTRAILLHLRKAGEQPAVLSEKPLSEEELAARLDSVEVNYTPVCSPLKPGAPALKANVVDLGAGKSFYSMLCENGIEAAEDGEDFDVCIVSNAPSFLAEDPGIPEMIREAAAGKPLIGFGDGAALAALAAGYKAEPLTLGHHGTNIPVAMRNSGGKNEITAQNHCYVVGPQKGIVITAVNLHDKTAEAFRSKDGMVTGFCYKPADLIKEIK